MIIFLNAFNMSLQTEGYVPPGKCDEYLSMWPLSDYAGQEALRCFSLITVHNKAVACYYIIR